MIGRKMAMGSWQPIIIYKLCVLTSAFLIVLWTTSNSFATPITLTGDGLGLSEGNYGSSLVVSDDLTLFAITRIGQTGYGTPDGSGIPGTVFVHQTDGIGVKSEPDLDGKIGGSKEISGEAKHADEALIFDYSVAIDPNSIVLGLNKIDFAPDEVTLIIDVFSGSDFTIPEASIEEKFIFTGTDIGYLNFRDLTEISGVDSLSAFTVRAWDGHFYVNSIDYAPVPEPATLLLLGSGLVGIAVFRRKFRRG